MWLRCWKVRGGHLFSVGIFSDLSSTYAILRCWISDLTLLFNSFGIQRVASTRENMLCSLASTRYVVHLLCIVCRDQKEEHGFAGGGGSLPCSPTRVPKKLPDGWSTSERRFTDDIQLQIAASILLPQREQATSQLKKKRMLLRRKELIRLQSSSYLFKCIQYYVYS